MLDPSLGARDALCRDAITNAIQLDFGSKPKHRSKVHLVMISTVAEVTKAPWRLKRLTIEIIVGPPDRFILQARKAVDLPIQAFVGRLHHRCRIDPFASVQAT